MGALTCVATKVIEFRAPKGLGFDRVHLSVKRWSRLVNFLFFPMENAHLHAPNDPSPAFEVEDIRSYVSKPEYGHARNPLLTHC